MYSITYSVQYQFTEYSVPGERLESPYVRFACRSFYCQAILSMSEIDIQFLCYRDMCNQKFLTILLLSARGYVLVVITPLQRHPMNVTRWDTCALGFGLSDREWRVACIVPGKCQVQLCDFNVDTIFLVPIRSFLRNPQRSGTGSGSICREQLLYHESILAGNLRPDLIAGIRSARFDRMGIWFSPPATTIRNLHIGNTVVFN
jgi:hypothetical protein